MTQEGQKQGEGEYQSLQEGPKAPLVQNEQFINPQNVTPQNQQFAPQNQQFVPQNQQFVAPQNQQIYYPPNEYQNNNQQQIQQPMQQPMQQPIEQQIYYQPQLQNQQGYVNQLPQQPQQPQQVVIVRNTNPHYRHDNNLMIWAIIACCCCFWPTGLCAIYYAHMSSQEYHRGDTHGAEHYARKARSAIKISVCIGVTWLTLVIVMNVIVGSTASSNSNNQWIF